MPEPDERAVAQHPQLAVSAAIFRKTRGVSEMLLVRRAVQPASGLYTLPGGRVEFGETLIEALAREVREETGLTIDIVALAGYREIILPDSRRHFVILPFAAHWRSGDVILNDELDDYQWILPETVTGFATTDGLADIVAAARTLAGM